jgi:hypothetical protein
VRGLAAFRQQLEECLEYAEPAEPPEPLPDAVPIAELAWQGTPSYAVHRKIMQGFQELTVVMPRLSTLRLRRIKHLQHD